MMKKGIARMGIFGLFPLVASPCFAFSVGDLLISEIMADPAAISDTRGEWIELYNPGIEPINLRGLDLGDDGGNRHRFDSDLLILPGEFLTLARSADPGFVPDYVYDNFTLANSDDEIVLRDGSLELLRLDYGAGFVQAGISRELQRLPMIASNFGLTLASLNYGTGDIGTPGEGAGMLFAPAAVPLPAAAWLFVSGLLTVFAATVRKSISPNPHVTTASLVSPLNSVIRLNPVIPAQAARSDVSVRRIGISNRPKVPTPGPTLTLRISRSLQS
jgi:hypothetical protein